MCNKKQENEDIKDIPHKDLEKIFGIPEHPEIPEPEDQKNIILGEEEKNNPKKTS